MCITQLQGHFLTTVKQSMAIKKRLIILPITIIVVAVLIHSVLSNMRQAPPRQAPERLPVLVEYTQVQFGPVQFSVPTQGNVMPRFATQLTAEVGGRIRWVSEKFVAGGFFSKDEVLFRIDDFDYKTAVEEAKANLARAQAMVAEERARGQVAEAEWRSIQAGEIPELGLRRPQLASELANLQSAQARLAQAERNFERTQVKAPFNGVLQSRNVNLGQFIAANANIGAFFGTDVAEIRVALSEFDLSLLPDLSVLTSADAYPEALLRAEVAGESHEWRGQLVRTEGVIDADTRVTYAVIAVQDPYNLAGEDARQALPFGRFVRIYIEGIEVSDLVELPRYAVSSNHQVWVITPERTLELRDVEVFRRDRNAVFIRSGLANGELVMLTQLENPLNGLRVRIPGEANQHASADSSTDVSAANGE